MDPVSLVLNALTSGAAQGIAGSVSDAVQSAYGKLKELITVASKIRCK
jgi:phenylpyruvate tautomerase PptA (4-oxalocrotonate tautomerase family)